VSGFKERMIEAVERGECSDDEAYDYVRDADASVSDNRERRGLSDMRRDLGRAPTSKEWEEERR
jgi:hypothetical protein